MKIKNLFIFLFVLVSLGFAQKKNFTVKEIFTNRDFYGKSLQGVKWFDGGEKYSYVKFNEKTFTSDLYEHDVKTGEEKLILTSNELRKDSTAKPFRISYYKWSSDNQYILFTSFLHYRYSKPGGDIILYNVKNKSVIRIEQNNDEIWVPELSPDNKKIAFVKNDNLFVYDIATSKEKQLTFDGDGTILNGHFDWVYQEEFGAVQGYQWAPDSKSIAFYRLDQSNVPEIQIAKWDSLYFNFMKFRYPKAGAKNSIVKIGVINLQNDKINWMNLGDEEDIYIPKIRFTKKSNLLSVQRLNRLQNHLELLFFDINTGTSKVIIDETSAAWIDIKNEPKFLKDGNHFIWLSESDGYLHFYLYDYQGNMINQITKGNWEVKKLVGIDESERKLYYTSNERGTIYQDFYRINFNGTEKEQLSEEKGANSAILGKKYFILTHSSANEPSSTSLYKKNGEKVKDLIVNNYAVFNNYNMSKKEFLEFTTSDGVSLNAFMIKPTNFDKTKKYPVLFYNYSGPGSQIVKDNRRSLWNYLLAQKGYIVFGLDNRGTGGRGTEFKHLVYKKLGTWEVNDMIEGVKYLSTISYVDTSRIGIWGWSYGGYMSALTLAKAPEYFKMAISVAPVTDWRFYDNIYTERYMSLPELNKKGYDEASVLAHAKNIKGKLLLVHGTGDDNVHFQNSVKLVEELVKNDIQFQTMYYPESNHSMNGPNARLHLYQMMTEFILNNL
jgi:dipeptidyl-peptidase-4